MTTDERLAVIETQLGHILETLNEHAAAVEKTNDRQTAIADRQEVRIRSLERFRNIAIGVMLVVGSGTGAAWRFLA